MNWHECSLKDIAEHSKNRDIIKEYPYGTDKNNAPRRSREVIEFNDGTMAASSLDGNGGTSTTPIDPEIEFWLYK